MDIMSNSAWALYEAALKEVESIRKCSKLPRQERLSGIHNPWGIGATLIDPWPFLDLCTHSVVVESVMKVLDPNVILWDSELFLISTDYRKFATSEGTYWPVAPLTGAIIGISMDGLARYETCCIQRGTLCDFLENVSESPLLIARYMSAASLFKRDLSFSANQRAMEARPLVNYTTRPLWLVHGEDLADNDFVGGFAPPVPRWTGPQ